MEEEERGEGRLSASQGKEVGGERRPALLLKVPVKATKWCHIHDRSRCIGKKGGET